MRSSQGMPCDNMWLSWEDVRGRFGMWVEPVLDKCHDESEWIVWASWVTVLDVIFGTTCDCHERTFATSAGHGTRVGLSPHLRQNLQLKPKNHNSSLANLWNATFLTWSQKPLTPWSILHCDPSHCITSQKLLILSARQQSQLKSFDAWQVRAMMSLKEPWGILGSSFLVSKLWQCWHTSNWNEAMNGPSAQGFGMVWLGALLAAEAWFLVGQWNCLSW